MTEAVSLRRGELNAYQQQMSVARSLQEKCLGEQEHANNCRYPSGEPFSCSMSYFRVRCLSSSLFNQVHRRPKADLTWKGEGVDERRLSVDVTTGITALRVS